MIYNGACIISNSFQNQMFQTLPSVNFVAAKTFAIDSCDQIVASVLKEYGWKQISKSSISWNLKWTWRTTPKQYETIQNGQIINHFKGSDELSTKLGLSLLYKRTPAVMDCGRSFTHFYPRSFNLNTQKQEFIRNFIETGVFNLLKKIVVCLQLFHNEQYLQAQQLKLEYRNIETKDILHQAFYNENEGLRQNNVDSKKMKISGKLFIRLLFFLENIFSLENHFEFEPRQLVELCEYSTKQIPFHDRQSNSPQQIVPSLLSFALLLKYHQKCIKNVIGYFEDGFSNIWVIKSNHSSRGRNIQLVDNIKDVQNMDNGMKLVQKYIENIWVLHQMTENQKNKYPSVFNIVKKKFDMRFWVLVKSFSPLIVYVYNEAYLRISSQSYRLDVLNEKNSHLTNFSVNWKSKQKSDESQTSYLLYSHFVSFLKEEHDVDTSKLTKRIHSIILETLKLVDIKSDPRCFEIFGFDILLDAKLNPWILECNMSPACAPRGQLRNVVKQMTTGLLSILGLIQTSTFGWKLLYNQKKRISKFMATCRVFKQTNQNRFTCAAKQTVAQYHDILLSGQKIKLKKYLKIEQIQYYLEKVTLIQRFLKTKVSDEKDKSQHNEKKSLRVLLMLQTLSKLIKKAKKNSWLSLVPIKQRKLSKRKSKPL